MGSRLLVLRPMLNADWDATSGDAEILNKPVLAPSDAEANVNADWDASSGDAEILNKPTIPVLPAAASQAEAGAGSEGALRGWSPLRVRQAITGWWGGVSVPWSKVTGAPSIPGPVTDDDVLDLAQSTRTSADRGKVLGVSETNEDALSLLDAGGGVARSGFVRRVELGADSSRTLSGQSAAGQWDVWTSLASYTVLSSQAGGVSVKGRVKMDAVTASGGGGDRYMVQARVKRTRGSVVSYPAVDIEYGPRNVPYNVNNTSQVFADANRDVVVAVSVDEVCESGDVYELEARATNQTVSGSREFQYTAGGETWLSVSGLGGVKGDKGDKGDAGADGASSWGDITGKPAEASASEASTGTEVGVRLWSPLRVRGAAESAIESDVEDWAEVANSATKIPRDKLADAVRDELDGAADASTLSISGSVLSISDNDGESTSVTLPAGGEDNVQADWSETDTADDSFIQNKPVQPSVAEARAGTATVARLWSAQNVAIAIGALALRTWASITGKPATATRWPTWAEVTGKPAEASAAEATAGSETGLRLWSPVRVRGAVTGWWSGVSVAWSKLTGIPATASRWPTYAEVTGTKPPVGAEVNVQSDWDASSGDALILNKPTILTVDDASMRGCGRRRLGLLVTVARCCRCRPRMRIVWCCLTVRYLRVVLCLAVASLRVICGCRWMSRSGL